MEVVDAKRGLLTLIRKDVIIQEVQTDIEGARNDKTAREILYKHLRDCGTVDTLRVYCEEIIQARGLPRMQALGKKMMTELEKGGW